MRHPHPQAKVSEPPLGHYIASTKAAALAGLCYGYFRRLVRSEHGPAIGFTEDGKDFFSPEEIKVWAASKPWLKPEETKLNRRKRIDKRVHIVMDGSLLAIASSYARQRNMSLSRLVREALVEYMRKGD